MLGCFFGGRGCGGDRHFGSVPVNGVRCCVVLRARARFCPSRRFGGNGFSMATVQETQRERERGLIKIHLKVKLNEMPYAVSLGESADRRGPPAVTRTSVIRVTI